MARALLRLHLATSLHMMSITGTTHFNGDFRSICSKVGKQQIDFIRLTKYLNIQDCLEKSLKIKFALKSTGKTLKGLEKSLNFTIYRRIQHGLWRYKSL